MSLLGNIWVKLGLKSDDFNKGMDDAHSKAERFGTAIGRVSARLVLGFAAITAAVLKFGRDSVKNYNEAEAATIKLQNALERAGGTIGVNANELNEYASELQRVNGYAGDATKSAMATLTTFRSVQGKVFKDTIAAAQDMASFLGTDLNAAVQQLGRALEAPEMGITMLRRSGVVFTKEMTDNIHKLVNEGKTYEAQLLILQEVTNRFGGEAARQADTAAGQWRRVGQAFGDLTVHIGAANNATKGLATSLATALESADKIISSEALTGWEKFKVIVLGLGQAKAADKMVQMDKAQQQLTAHAEEYVKKTVEGLDTIEKAQAQLKKEQDGLAKAQGDQRKADHQAAINAIKSQIQALNEKKAKEEEAAREAAEEAKQRQKEEEERIRREKSLINHLKDEIAAKEELRDYATDETEIRKYNTEIALLKEKLDKLQKITEIQKLPEVSAPTDILKATPDKVNVVYDEKAVRAWTHGINSAIDTAEAFSHAIQSSVIGSIDALADALESGEWDTATFVKAMIEPLANAAITAGTLILTTGESLEALKKAFVSWFGAGPYAAIAAGAALIAIGSAAKIGMAAIASGSKSTAGGGSAYSNPYTYAGGYGTAPAAGYGASMELSGTVTVKGQDLQIALDNYNRNRGR